MVFPIHVLSLERSLMYKMALPMAQRSASTSGGHHKNDDGYRRFIFLSALSPHEELLELTSVPKD